MTEKHKSWTMVCAHCGKPVLLECILKCAVCGKEFVKLWCGKPYQYTEDFDYSDSSEIGSAVQMAQDAHEAGWTFRVIGDDGEAFCPDHAVEEDEDDLWDLGILP